jgi:hypothetical protein
MGGAGGPGPTEPVPVWKSATAFTVFALGNIGLNYFNSWALSDPSDPDGVPGHGKGGFKMPFFYTMWHMLASCVAAFILQATCAKPKDGSLPSFGQIWEYKWELVPIAFLTFVNNGFNNASLGAVALYVNQVIKACGPLPTSGFEYLLMGKVYNGLIYGIICVLVVGAIMSNAPSFAAGGSSQIGGIIQVLVSLAAATLRPVLQKLAMSGGSALNPCGGACGSSCLKPSEQKSSKASLSPSQVLFWDTGLAFCIFFVMFLCNIEGERDEAFKFLGGQTSNPNSGWLGAGIIVFGASLAFMFNIAMYYFIMYTSALAAAIGGNGVKIFLIVISALTTTDPGTAAVGLVVVKWFGIATVVLAIVAYAYFSFQFAQAAKKEPPKPDEETPLSKA